METLRLYPSVVVVPKYCMEDTAVPFLRQTADGLQKEQTVIPAGGEVFLNAVALHYNRKEVVHQNRICHLMLDLDSSSLGRRRGSMATGTIHRHRPVSLAARSLPRLLPGSSGLSRSEIRPS